MRPASASSCWRGLSAPRLSMRSSPGKRRRRTGRPSQAAGWSSARTDRRPLPSRRRLLVRPPRYRMRGSTGLCWKAWLQPRLIETKLLIQGCDMNHRQFLACCSVLMASASIAQTQPPLTGAMASEATSYPVAPSPAAAAAPAEPAQPAAAERQPYETYRLTQEQVHPWPEVEGLPVHVQNERRHIPPVLQVG